ncbi:hypothetical protein B0H14DRAFT_3702556 [Mycena olivaceomarginata]|nr:hypothetical protein B0H14DRAFT_3702556 [Mycena olivaceomarginata]
MRPLGPLIPFLILALRLAHLLPQKPSLQFLYLNTLSLLSLYRLKLPSLAFPRSQIQETLLLLAHRSFLTLPMHGDMATRIIAGWYFVHQDAADYPTTNFDAFNPANEETSTCRRITTKSCARSARRARIVLVGNDAGPGKVGPNEFADQGGVDGILAMGWGSGTANFTYLVSPLEAIQRRAREDRTSVSWILDDFDKDPRELSAFSG